MLAPLVIPTGADRREAERRDPSRTGVARAARFLHSAPSALRSKFGARIDGLEARIDRLEARFDARMDGLEAELREIRDRLSRLEGKVDFLESYIVRRNEAGAPAE